MGFSKLMARLFLTKYRERINRSAFFERVLKEVLRVGFLALIGPNEGLCHFS